jgi:hypothetical protein
MKKKIQCFLVIICCCGFCAAQQVVSSGGCALESGFSFNWILGSLSDVPSDSIILNVQLIESEISLIVYPSPATDLINIEIKPACAGQLIIELYNYKGSKVLNRITSYQPVLQVNVSDIPLGVYLLRISVLSKDQPIKVEKIIKK